VLRAILNTADDDKEWEKVGAKTPKQVAGKVKRAIMLAADLKKATGEDTPTPHTDLAKFWEMLYETEVWDRPKGSREAEMPGEI
jgi:hypothetical protein